MSQLFPCRAGYDIVLSFNLCRGIVVQGQDWTLESVGGKMSRYGTVLLTSILASPIDAFIFVLS